MAENIVHVIYNIHMPEVIYIDIVHVCVHNKF